MLQTKEGLEPGIDRSQEEKGDRGMNPYVQHLNRIEFLITLACTGRCKHCSEGAHPAEGEWIDGEAAARAVDRLCDAYAMESLMTFGGEPLLHPDVVCRIHAAARDRGIPKRQLITNGFFSKEPEKIKETAEMLSQSGVNDILLSVDAFHQETIPIKPVKDFAQAVMEIGIPLRAHPAWLVGWEAKNPYNQKTLEILEEFARMGVAASDGNTIFPSGNALKYLKGYFDPEEKGESPYEQDPEDVRSLCVSPNGDVLGGNLYQTDLLDIIEAYAP